MSDYGLTTQGVNIKRLDTIIDEMHTDLTEKWGVNTRQNTSSLLNVLITDIADELAELWEFGEDIYNNTYPQSAEGMYLDNATQFAGITREEAAKSFYHILCTGKEGTIISTSTKVCTNTNPVTELSPVSDYQLLRTQFNKAVVKSVSVDGNPFTVVLNGETYSVTPGKGTSAGDALKLLCDSIADSDFNVYVDEDKMRLSISAVDVTSQNVMVLSENLTTDSIGCVFTFGTDEYGDIYLPDGSITVIEKSVTGLDSIVNVGTYIKGRLVESDSEFRQSYIDKIFSHSSRMVKSIKSAILTNVQGVTSVSVYENCRDEYDEQGRYPHSVEVVCDGGEATDIARQILNTKAGGINTFGSTSVVINGDYDDDITIRFNRPEYVKTWFHVTLTIGRGMSISTDYVEIVKDIITSTMEGLECGDDVIPQSLFLPNIYGKVGGIDYVDVRMGTGNDEPSEYKLKNVYVSERQKAVTSEGMIEVVIDE
jgi:uncharacterized phage protein gp47/JayE